jgi:hypothetical protein
MKGRRDTTTIAVFTVNSGDIINQTSDVDEDNPTPWIFVITSLEVMPSIILKLTIQPMLMVILNTLYEMQEGAVGITIVSELLFMR